MNPSRQYISPSSSSSYNSVPSSYHEQVNPNDSFHHTTRHILCLLNDAVIAESFDLFFLDSECQRFWRNTLMAARSNIATGRQAQWIVRSLTIWIQQLLAERISRGVLSAVSAAVYARVEQNNIIEIARHMLIAFEQMLAYRTEVTGPTRRLLEQLSDTFEPLGLTIQDISSSATAASTNSHPTSISQESDEESGGDFTDLGWATNPADPDEIRYLDNPPHTWTMERHYDPEDLCTICQERMVTGEMVTKTPCGHSFHRDCLRPWLLGFHKVCPNCRFAVLQEEHAMSESSSSVEEVADEHVVGVTQVPIVEQSGYEEPD